MTSSIRILALLASLFAAASPLAAAERLTAFYVPWDAASLADLQRHAGQIDTLAPVWLSVAGPMHDLRIAPDPVGRATIAALRDRPRLLLTVQNFAEGDWDGGNADALLNDPAASARLVDALAVQVREAGAAGVVIDFERLSDKGLKGLILFVKAARPKLGRVEVAVPVGDAGWDLPAVAAVADGLILMAYDQHWSTGEPGPVAGIDWYAGTLAKLPDAVRRGKLVAGIAGYAYDWPAKGGAATLAVPAARALADAHGTSVVVDGPSGNGHFTYDAEDGRHSVWTVPADAMTSEIAAAHSAGIMRIALWRLGTEDPGFWADRTGDRR